MIELYISDGEKFRCPINVSDIHLRANEKNRNTFRFPFSFFAD